MWAIRALISRLTALTHCWSLRYALALPSRGGIRDDQLKLKRVSNRLQLEWIARDIHPWDRDDLSDVQAEKFFDQFLADTENAIDRLFTTLPHLDQIDVTVRDPASDAVIASGTMDRVGQDNDKSTSTRMRLMARGLRCDLNEAYFQRLEGADGAAVVH